MKNGHLLVCLGFACSRGSGQSGTLGMDSVRALADLSLAEQQSLCDWIAHQFGGYHSRGICADSSTGGLQGPVNQSGCIDQLSAYARSSLTVGQLQACIESEVRNACNWYAVAPTPECRPLGSTSSI